MGEYGPVFSNLFGKAPPSTRVLFKMDEGLPEERLHDSIEGYFVDKCATAHYCH